MVAATAGMGWLVLDASNYLRSDTVSYFFLEKAVKLKYNMLVIAVII